MNKIVIAVLVLAVIVGGGYLLLQSQKTTSPSTAQNVTTQNKTETNMEEGAEEAKVTISNFSFSPETVKVKVGGSVTWTNNDSVSHTVTADNGEFNTDPINKGQSTTLTFDQKGTFTYHCTPHPNMQATVVVE
jgi:plastocyanin